MALSIEIQYQSGINLNHFANLAEEYFGTVLNQNEQSLNLFFSNHSHAQNFRKTVQPYFLSGSCHLVS